MWQIKAHHLKILYSPLEPFSSSSVGGFELSARPLLCNSMMILAYLTEMLRLYYWGIPYEKQWAPKSAVSVPHFIILCSTTVAIQVLQISELALNEWETGQDVFIYLTAYSTVLSLPYSSLDQVPEIFSSSPPHNPIVPALRGSFFLHFPYPAADFSNRIRPLGQLSSIITKLQCTTHQELQLAAAFTLKEKKYC